MTDYARTYAVKVGGEWQYGTDWHEKDGMLVCSGMGSDMGIEYRFPFSKIEGWKMRGPKP